MRSFFLFLYCLFGVLALEAQESGYLYIESENGQPFYVRSKDSLYLSAPEGFLILAPLTGIKGDLVLGFPGQAAAAFVFTIPNSGIESGWLLRSVNGEGWRLYDYRLDELVNIRRLGRAENRFSGMQKRTDAFALQLSKVVNDTAILYSKPAPVQPAPTIQLVSQTEKDGFWILVYELTENGRKERVEIEIPKEKGRIE
jgi:hypothetical protein